MFKIGDRVEFLEHCGRDDREFFIVSKEYTITRDDEDGFCYLNDNKMPITYDQIKLKEATMDLRARIEALTAWDKEADDILQEIGSDYAIYIPTRSEKSRSIGICNVGFGNSSIKSFNFEDQCSKLSAFKEALLWLAEKTGKLDDKSKLKEEIAQLREKLTELEKKL